MKKLVLPFVIVAIALGLYEQTKEKPNTYVLVITVLIFMYGMMKLSAKTPSKNIEKEGENDSERR
jgi:hypothetical protein